MVLVPVRERSHKHRFPPSAAKSVSVIFYSHRCVSQDARTIPACLRDAVLGSPLQFYLPVSNTTQFSFCASCSAVTELNLSLLPHRYNTCMKLIFIGSSGSVIWYMRRHKVVSQTYDAEQDTFRVFFLIGPCMLLALLINHEFSVTEVLWTFSIYLEAVAILPQLVLLQRTKNVDTLTGNYVFLLGGYRALYLLNWIYRFFTEPGYSQWIVWVSGAIQTAVYCDFFYYYLKSWHNNERLSLPS